MRLCRYVSRRWLVYAPHIRAAGYRLYRVQNHRIVDGRWAAEFATRTSA